MNYLYAFIISVIIIVIFVIAGRISYFSFQKEKFSFKKYFPYEMETPLTFPYLRIIASLATGSLLFFHADFFLFEKSIEINDFLSVFLAVIFMIQDLFLFLMFTTRMEASFKRHIVVASLFLSLTFFGNLFGILMIYRSLRFPHFMCIPFLIITLLELIIIFLPNLKNWAHQDKDEKKKRSESNTLAISQWIFIACSYITCLTFVITRLIGEML